MKISVAFGIFLALGMLISLSAQSYPPDGWRVWMTIENAAGSQRYPAMATTGNTVHVIWVDNRSAIPQLYYKKSDDLGFTWSEGILISAQNQALVDAKRNIGIACVNNYVYAIYSTAPNPTDQHYAVCFVRSTDGGASWGGHQTIESGLDSPPEPTIVATPDSVRIAYRRQSGDLICLIYRASGNHGTNWTSEDFISFDKDDRYPHLAMVNNIPHAVLIRHYQDPIPTTYVLHAKPALPVWEKSQIMNYGSYHYPLLAVDREDRLHAIWERTDYSIWYARSLDNGNSWQDLSMISDGSFSSSLTTYQRGVLIVYQTDNKIRGRLSTDFGVNWEEPFIIDNQANAYGANCFVASGATVRHLVYQKSIVNPYDYDLVYMANDDLLLSDNNRATAFNNGRHLIRDPNTGPLHLVYHSQNRVHYSMSDYTGENWTPYHILEDPETQQKDEGWYPTIGLVPGWLVAKMPCIVYCSAQGEVKYRWLEDGTQQWHGFTILSAQTGLDPGPPSVVTYGDTVYVVFSVNMLEGEQLWSAIYFYQFPYYATEPPAPMVLDYEPGTPLAYKHASITVDGNRNPHVVWDKWIPWTDYEIYYRWRENGNWHGIELVSNIIQPEYADISPHIDCYGNWLSVVWYDEILGLPNEIQRRIKMVSGGWSGVKNYSQSPGIPSEFPVNAAHDFSVWCEIGNASDYDIRYRSDTYGFGWVSQAPEKEYFCHSQLQRDYSPWDIYTIFTRGNTTPYQIVCAHQQFGSGPPGGESPLYIVETGNDSISPFCLHRDGIITYANYSVDYGTSELIYELCLLDPTFPFHKIKGTAYFQGNGNRTYELWINGVRKHTLTVRPNIPYDFEVLIPKELYQNNNRINLTIKNPNNTGVCLAGLRVYRKPDGRSGGGPQSCVEKTTSSRIAIYPNPFKDRLEIRLNTVPKSGRNCQLKIYDISGRLVKTFSNLQPEHNVIMWNGTGEDGTLLSAGVYFIHLQTDEKEIVAKAILLR